MTQFLTKLKRFWPIFQKNPKSYFLLLSFCGTLDHCKGEIIVVTSVTRHHLIPLMHWGSLI